VQNGPNYWYWDSRCAPWQNAYNLTNILPNQTAVRVAINNWYHFNSASARTPYDYQRYINAIHDRIMFRGFPNVENGLNITWVFTPGIPPADVDADGWPDNPRLRDWWLPAVINRANLKAQFQIFVSGFNNQVLETARAWNAFRGVPNQPNILNRVGYQLGNEVGGTHPGGSQYNDIGSWKGVGQLLEETTNGLNYGADPFFVSRYGVNPGGNKLTLPAFSFLTEGRGDVHFNTLAKTDGSALNRSFEWSGALTPGLNEIFSYYDELYGPNNNYGWATQTSGRAFHFRSPGLYWLRTDGITAGWPELNNDGTFNGGWESPAQYAVHWANDFIQAYKGYSRLPMPGQNNRIDVTECYLTMHELRSASFPRNGYSFTGKTEAQIRRDAQSWGSTRVVNNQTIFAQPPQLRSVYLAAIRDELYNRWKAGQLPNLGRIYWTKGYTPNPRFESGFPDFDPINAYYPWDDFTLNTAEIKALYALP
jgi:hypothetical protein